MWLEDPEIHARETHDKWLCEKNHRLSFLWYQSCIQTTTSILTFFFSPDSLLKLSHPKIDFAWDSIITSFILWGFSFDVENLKLKIFYHMLYKFWLFFFWILYMINVLIFYFKEHIDRCPKVPVSCPNQCGEEIEREQVLI